MALRRWLCAVALAGLTLGTGCAAWCARHYPCGGSGYGGYNCAPPPNCNPCCPPGSGYPAAPAPAWNQPVACPPGCR